MSFKMIKTSFWAVALILIIIMPLGGALGQEFYHRGDANADGWCNYADFLVVAEHLAGQLECPSYCPAGADANNNGYVDVADMVRLYDFFTNFISEPGGFCACPVMTCDQTENAFLYLQPVSDSDTMTASFDVYVGASVNISTLNFSFEYDPANIASVNASEVSQGSVRVNDRLQPSGIRIAGILFIPGNESDYPLEDPGTPIIHLAIARTQGGINDKMVIIEDPIFGPPRLYYGYDGESRGCRSITPYSPLYPGDANASGTVNGQDVTYLVNWFKGNISFPPVERSFWNIQVKWEY